MNGKWLHSGAMDRYGVVVVERQAQYSASTASDAHATNNCVQQPPTHTRARKIGYRNSARFQATPGNKSTATGSAEHAREYLRRP